MFLTLAWICTLVAIAGTAYLAYWHKKEELALKALERDAKNNQHI